MRLRREFIALSIPLLGIVLCLRQLGDARHPWMRDRRFSARQYHRIEQFLIP
jgi:hypothetical protein